MDLVRHDIEAYAERFTTPESKVLAELNRKTWAEVLTPRMLSGHLQGQLLRMLSKLVRPERILEVGTYTGYSALCLADGLAEGGELHTIDINAELETLIRQYIAKAGMEDRIHLHVGDARQIIPKLEGTFDLVFIDADKENYATYFDLVVKRVNQGGLIIADNVLWSGKVLAGDAATDVETLALHRFNQKVMDDPRVENILLPIRDGLMVMRRV